MPITERILERSFVAILLIGISAFTAWGLWLELTPGEFQYSDVTFHLSLLRELDEVVRDGGSAFDFWYDASPFGYPVFRVYQHLPHLIVYASYRALGTSVPLETLIPLWTIGLACALPFSMYWAARVIGCSTLASVVVGVFAVLLVEQGSYGFGLESYVWGTNGIITQLWALVFLAPACAYVWRVLSTGTGWGVCVLLSFLAIGCHILAGYVIGVSIVVGLVSELLIGARAYRIRFGRFFGLLALLAFVTAHQWLFILQDHAFIHRSAFEPEWKFAGHGIKWTIGQLFMGGLFDRGRFPIVTILLVVGLSTALCTRARPRMLAMVAVSFLLWLSLLCGYDLWGGLFQTLPLFSAMHMHRFIIGVQLFGLLLAGFGCAVLLSWIPSLFLRYAIVVLLLVIPLQQQRIFFEQQHERIKYIEWAFTEDSDTHALLAFLEERPRTWIYAGMARTWAKKLVVAKMAEVYHLMVARGLPTMGMLFHSMGRAGDALFAFEPENEEHYRLYGVGTVVAPSDWTAPPFLTRLAQFGRYQVFGYDAGSVLSLEREEFEGASSSELYAHVPVKKPFVEASMGDGEYTSAISDVEWSSQRAMATVVASRQSKVVFRETFHPGWAAWVDGTPATIRPIEPGFMQVVMPEGEHHVLFEYQPSRVKSVLFWCGLFGCLGAFVLRKRNLNWEGAPGSAHLLL